GAGAGGARAAGPCPKPRALRPCSGAHPPPREPPALRRRARSPLLGAPWAAGAAPQRTILRAAASPQLPAPAEEKKVRGGEEERGRLLPLFAMSAARHVRPHRRARAGGDFNRAAARRAEGHARRGRAARRARRAGRTAAGRPQAGLRLSRSRRGLRLNHAVAAPQLGEEPLCGELDASALSCGAPRGGELRRDGARTFKVIFSTQGRSGTASETHSAAEHCLHSDAEIAVASVSAPAVPPGIWQPKGFAPEAPAMQLDTLFTALGVVAPAVEVAVPEEMSKHTATPEAAGSLSGGAEDRAKPALEPVVDGLPLDRCRKLL
ncbi:unnamed protein product, partial [Prorocentrum cordatum]